MATPDSLDKELNKLTQATGSVAGGGLNTVKGRASWQINTRTDIASIIYQLNVVYYNIVKSLTDGTDPGRENVLDVGIAGTNIICYQDATEGSCYWADFLEKPATIKEVFDCVLARVSELENQITAGVVEVEVDLSEVESRLDCIENNLLQQMKDTLGDGSYGCDGDADFSYSLASMINALGANFDGFTAIHTVHADESTPGPYTLSILSSNITWDVPVAQSNVYNLKTHLNCIRAAIGFTGPLDCSNSFSTESPSAASAGNNWIADGDSLREAIKALDSAVGSGNAWSEIYVSNLGGGAAAGGPAVADSAGDRIRFDAGPGIGIAATDDPEQIRWSVYNYSLQDAYRWNDGGRITLDNTKPAGKAGLIIEDNVTPVDSVMLGVVSNGLATRYFEFGQHENYSDDPDYATHRLDLHDSPIYMAPQSLVPGTTGPGLPAPFNGDAKGAIFVSTGSLTVEDANGNLLVADRLYFREPENGTIHDLTCCYELSDGYVVNDPPTLLDPHDTVYWYESESADTRLSRTGNSDFLVYGEHPSNGGQVHWSIGVIDPTANDTAGADGANYVAIDFHQTPLLLSKLPSATNIPETLADQGAIFIPNDATSYGGAVSAGRLYYREPGNGAIHDLTNAAGASPNLWNNFFVDYTDGLIVSDAFPIKTAATGQIDFSAGALPADGEQITITNTSGTSVVYTATSGATDAPNGLFTIAGTATDAAAGLELCIDDAAGHNGTIITTAALGVLDLEQNVAGVNGNTTMPNNFSGGTSITSFSGGTSKDTPTTSNDTFTFVAGDGIAFEVADGRLEISASIAGLVLTDLSDVNAPSPTVDQVIVYDGAEYVNADYTLTQTAGASGLSLVGADTAGGGKTVKGLNALSSKISIADNVVDIDIDLGTVNLDDLSDVSVAAPTTGDAVIWTGAAWQAVAKTDYRIDAISVGTGEAILKQRTADEIQIKTLDTSSTSALSVYSAADTVFVDFIADYESVTATGPVTIDLTDPANIGAKHVFCDTTLGAVTVELPNPGTTNDAKEITVSDVGGAASGFGITVTTVGGVANLLKNGSAPSTSLAITSDYASLTFASTGTAWEVIAITEATGGGGGGESLSATLAIGSLTGGNNIDVSTGDIINGVAELGLTAAAGDVTITATGASSSIVLNPDAAGDVTVNGKLTVTGVIDPTGLILEQHDPYALELSPTATQGTIVVSDGSFGIQSDTPFFLSANSLDLIPMFGGNAISNSQVGGSFTTSLPRGTTHRKVTLSSGATLQLNLPSASSSGGVICLFEHVDGGGSASTLTLAADVGDTVDGLASITVAANTKVLLVCEGGTSWSTHALDSGSSSTGLQLTTDDALVLGDLLVVNSSGNVELADATSSPILPRVVGASSTAYSAAATATINSSPGTLVPVRFDAGSPPGALDNGKPVYLSDVSPGLGTLTAPTASGTTVFVVGILQGADGVSATPDVIFQPNFIAYNP